ncbi:MAG TPA: fimbria/pilus periplasmic chaperone [Steroidobacteraceae bacterium]|nr:fimbria/pilus periplasmic chaperone [Steroidobacteraceae bacterium]
MKLGILGQAALGLAIFFSATPLSRAGSFSVNPVRVTLSPGHAVAALTVRNDGSDASVIQLETSRWTQQDGKDVLTASPELLATPPIFTLPPGGSQIVRVGLRRAPDAQHELTYRLILREVPPPQPIAQGLRVALAISMPVFVVSAHQSFSNLQWQAVRLADGQIQLQATNIGNAHVQVGSIELSSAGSSAPAVSESVATYVLPGNTRSWTFKNTIAVSVGATLALHASTDGGDLQARVTLGAAGAHGAPAAVAHP